MNKYYDDYQTLSFKTEVVDVKKENDKFWIGTKISSFFVAGGGMSNDCGVLNGLVVEDVKFENDLYYHLLDRELSGEVEGLVDSKSRLAKVQIHTAQHLISAHLINNYDLKTISHHVSADDNDIEFVGDATNVDVLTLQVALDDYLQQDLLVRISYPDKAEALKHASYEKVQHDELRVVQIGDIDYNLCGCIHVKKLSEINGIFIKSCEKTKQGVIVHYLAGQQIFDYFYPRFLELNKATQLLALDHLHIAEGIKHLIDENKQLNFQVAELRQEKLLSLANGLLKEDLIIQEFEGLSVKDGQFLISALRQQKSNIHAFILLKLVDDRCHLLVSYEKADEVFKSIALKFNLKGGGSATLAQGGGQYCDGLLGFLKETYYIKGD